MIFASLFLAQMVGGACTNQGIEHVEVVEPQDVVGTPSPTPRPIDPGLLALPASSLCDRLKEIEVTHDRVPEESDDLYKAILAKGSDALPCLIEKINDRTKTRDPRTAPKWQNYVVGDTAVFTILKIASQEDPRRWEELMLESLPPKYREEWKTNGVYAYFNYVLESRDRANIQRWWKKWLEVNKK